MLQCAAFPFEVVGVPFFTGMLCFSPNDDNNVAKVAVGPFFPTISSLSSSFKLNEMRHQKVESRWDGKNHDYDDVLVLHILTEWLGRRRWSQESPLFRAAADDVQFSCILLRIPWQFCVSYSQRPPRGDDSCTWTFAFAGCCDFSPEHSVQKKRARNTRWIVACCQTCSQQIRS